MPVKDHQHLRAKPDLNKQTSSKSNDKLIGAVSHMRGWRKTMEDADIFEFNIDGKGTNLFAVFDGHGGGQVAVFAKRHLQKLLLQNPNYKEGNYEKALKQTFPKLDALMMSPKGSDEIFQIKDQLDQKLKKEYQFQWEQDSEEIQCLAGSTAIVCLMTTDIIYIASLGDSRCIISSDRQLKILSIQHKPDLPQEKARIQAAGGKVKNNRINGLLGMSRSIGDFQFKVKKNKKMSEQMVINDPHIDTVANQNIQFILLGCDGIWEGHTDDWYFNEVHDRIVKSESPESIIEHILDSVVAPSLDGDDGHDNMTGILILNKKSNEI